MSVLKKSLYVLPCIVLFGTSEAAEICLPEIPVPFDTVVCSGATNTWPDYNTSVNNLTFILATDAVINSINLGGNANTATINGTNNGGLTLGGDFSTATNNGNASSIWAMGNNANIANYGGTGGITLDGNNYTVNNYGTVITSASGDVDVPNGAIDATAAGAGSINNTVFESIGGVINTLGNYMAGILVRDPGGPVNLHNQAEIGTEGEVLARASIFTSGFSAPGIFLVDDVGNVDTPDFNRITNEGTIETTGDESAGILLEPLFEEIATTGVTRIENLSSGIIITSGADAQGIRGYGHDVAVTNAGGILTQNADSAGIEVIGSGAVAVWNTYQGTIATEATFSPGIALAGEPPGEATNVLNEGNILTAGSDSPGIVIAGPFHDVDNTCNADPDCRSMIATTGDGSAGIQLGLVEPGLGIDAPSNSGTVNNGGAISTEGFFAPGISVIGTVNNATNGVDGVIETIGQASSGITINGSGNDVFNYGEIITTNLTSSGIFGTGLGITVNHMNGGSITTAGDGAEGIAIDGSRGRVEAASGSSITTSGDDAHGINITGSKSVVNTSSTLQINGNDSFGIRVSSSDASVLNSGTIGTIGNNADGIRAYSSPSSGVNNIRNTGNIVTTGMGADGIRASDSSYSINNTGGISTSGSNADGIVVSSLLADYIDTPVTAVNSGEISVSGPGSVAVRLEAKIAETTSFSNISTGIVSSSGVAVAGGDSFDEVTNNGVINGNVQLGAAVDRFVRGAGSAVDGIVDGGEDTDELFLVTPGTEEVVNGSKFVNFENNVVAGTGTLTLEGNLDVDNTVIDQATLNVTGTLDSLVSVQNGGRLGGSGTIAGDVDSSSGTIGPGTSIGDLTIGGNLLVNGGSLEFEANSLLDLDQLFITGDTSLSDGAIDVILGFTPEPDDVLDILFVEGTFDMSSEFDGIHGIAAAGSGVELGTIFAVSLGGELYQGTVTSVVPVPPAFWMFASGLLGLIGVARRKA